MALTAGRAAAAASPGLVTNAGSQAPLRIYRARVHLRSAGRQASLSHLSSEKPSATRKVVLTLLLRPPNHAPLPNPESFLLSNQAFYEEGNMFFKLTNELKVTAVLLDGIYEKAELKQIISCSVKKPKREMLVPRLASYEDLGRVHDATGQTCRVDGAQGGAQLHNVRPDERLRQQARVLSGQRPVVLTCEAQKKPSFNSSTKRLKHPKQN